MFLLIRGMAQIGWHHQRPEWPPSPELPRLKEHACATAAQFTPIC
ncbi:MAG TPA: hypothetical protein VGC09_10060 [Rhodopila sp.]